MYLLVIASVLLATSSGHAVDPWPNSQICQAAVFAYAGLASEPKLVGARDGEYHIRIPDGVTFRCTLVDDTAILEWNSADGLGISDPLPFRSTGLHLVVRTDFGDDAFILRDNRLIPLDR